ncbi:MAG TPA: amino acid ABC transporter permease [Bacilli bacterium]|nr:amino acid ABC transporter permease [Bacilli bacterium]
MDFSAFKWDYFTFMLHGFGITLFVAFLSIILAYVLGIFIALLRYARIPVLSKVLAVWVDIVRNLPLLLILFFMYFGLAEMGLDMTPTSAAITGLVLFESALISEIVRSGLTSIPKGQSEAARSSGLTYVQTMRYIVLPQALRRMIPPTVSQFISLLKDTSLAVIIVLPELMHSSQIIYNQNYGITFLVLFTAALMYFAVNYPLSMLARRLEKKLAN